MAAKACSLRFGKQRFSGSCLAITVFLALAPTHAETLKFRVPGGTLEVVTKDPAIEVTLEDEDLLIRGANVDGVRLKIGAHLFQSGVDGRPVEVLSLTRDDRTTVRVFALASQRGEIGPVSLYAPREELVRAAHQKAGELVTLRSNLDGRVWPIVSARYTTTEAAKLLITFFRGDGSELDLKDAPDDERQLRNDLSQLRKAREGAFRLIRQVALEDAENPISPLVGVWEVTKVGGAGGVAADALEIYEPDPVGRRFVATNDSAALLTGGGFWLFDATYPNDAPGIGPSVDLSVVVRGNTLYRALFVPNGNDGGRLSFSPMNKPRPAKIDDDPHDGGFVLTLRRAK
jgi:hypothetical protein